MTVEQGFVQADSQWSKPVPALPLRAVAYPFVLCAAAGAVLLALDYRRVLRQHRRLELLRQLPEEISYFATIVAD